MHTAYFIDFDGTITTDDTASVMIKAFVAETDYPAIMQISSLWEKRQISTKQCANRAFQYINADMNSMIELLDTITIDEGFVQFLDICTRSGDKAYVLSDGFDLCIQTVFKKYAIDIPFYANSMVYDNGFTIVCPHANPQCGHCGVCKTSLMQSIKKASSRSIYIGDGYSDTCPVMHADMVFAKEPLYTMCTDKGIEALRFSSFEEITDRLY
ncbi:MAG TPA: phosphoserine phosphatase [Deltaproteobacteria bacterium]|nr:phosphoserine phosphatase [Deltaproteobacteria bacterium]